MALRLEVRQAQSLTLTPQLMQSIKLLQLSHLELDAFVEAELLRNPLLEREEPESGDGEAPSPEGADQTGAGLLGQLGSAEGIADTFDTSVENVFPEQVGSDGSFASDGPFSSGGPWKEGGTGEGIDFDQIAARGETLAEHLWGQASLALGTPAERLIAGQLIDGLDPSGYLTVALPDVAALLGTTVEAVEAVLRVLQTCEPCGVFARSLAECLALQLREKNRLDPLMAKLLANLERLAVHDMVGLLRAVGTDRAELNDMLAELRALDPKPGRAFEGTPAETVVPDVFVREGTDGSWLVELNPETLPRVLVNRNYYAVVSRKTRDAGERSFLSECLQSASWLTKSLDQRAQTILKVASEIARQQDSFLRRGVAHLRPMTLKTVADAIGMHESTVSRVTSSKYLATSRGLFELKYFFTTALGSANGGEEHSAEAVRHRIRQLIEAEPPSDILSDDTIADMLKRESGIDVARRTVAKYREGMNIPSSVIRRRQKKLLVVS